MYYHHYNVIHYHLLPFITSFQVYYNEQFGSIYYHLFHLSQKVIHLLPFFPFIPFITRATWDILLAKINVHWPSFGWSNGADEQAQTQGFYLLQ